MRYPACCSISCLFLSELPTTCSMQDYGGRAPQIAKSRHFVTRLPYTKRSPDCPSIFTSTPGVTLCSHVLALLSPSLAPAEAAGDVGGREGKIRPAQQPNPSPPKRSCVCCASRMLPSTAPAGHATPRRSCSCTYQDMIRELTNIGLDRIGGAQDA